MWDWSQNYVFLTAFGGAAIIYNKLFEEFYWMYLTWKRGSAFNQTTKASKCIFEHGYTQLCEYTIYPTLSILPSNFECFLLPDQQFV